MARVQKRDPQSDSEEPEDHSFEEEMDDTPPTIDPYAVLGLDDEATAEDVRKAYRKLALAHHPDKVKDTEKSDAHKKFQEIAFAYAVLSDERRRKRYDLTGSTAESLEDDEDFDWLDFYRAQFQDVVTEENLKIIADEYKGGPQERKDLLKAYTKGKGSFDRIYQEVMLSDILEDDDRFRKILDEEIEKGTIESFPAYERENNDKAREKAKATERKRRADFDKHHGSTKEAAEKAKAKQKGKGKTATNDMGDLAAQIQQRQKSRMGGFFDNLEAKYAPKSRGKKRATPMDDEPTEEEFQAARKRLQKGTKNGRTAKKKVVEDEDEDLSEDVDLETEEEEATPPPKAKKRGGAKKSGGRAKTKA